MKKGLSPPTNQVVYPLSHEQTLEVEKQVQEQLKAGWIVESDTPYASPTFVVKKANGQFRIVIDFKKLNAVLDGLPSNLKSN